MDFSPRVCQVKATGTFRQPLHEAPLRKVLSGRAVFSPNHEMGSAAVLCDSTSVCDAYNLLVVDYSYHFRTTLAAVILDYMGLYCEAAWSPGWGHLYVSCFTWVDEMTLIEFSRSC